MADVVTTQVLSDTSGVKYVAKLTNLSDGSSESLVTKVDASVTTFMSEDATEKLQRYDQLTLLTLKCVELLWAGGFKCNCCIISVQGYWDLRTSNEITNNATTPTVDVLLSTRDFVVGDNYTILVEFR